jgi:quercetin dioxygenase-like cupin family protein
MDAWNVKSDDIEVHRPKVLRSDPDAARAVAINLPAGDQLQDHEVHEHAYVVVVDGELEITHNGGSLTAGPGTVAHFEPHERHEVRATRDSRFLLFLTPWTGAGRDAAGNRA